jgi:hypothetical protein
LPSPAPIRRRVQRGAKTGALMIKIMAGIFAARDE